MLSPTQTRTLSRSSSQPNTLFNGMARRPILSSFQAHKMSHSCSRSNHEPSEGVSKGSTEPETSRSSAQPITSWPCTSAHCSISSRCRVAEVDSSVRRLSRILPSTRMSKAYRMTTQCRRFVDVMRGTDLLGMGLLLRSTLTLVVWHHQPLPTHRRCLVAASQCGVEGSVQSVSWASIQVLDGEFFGCAFVVAVGALDEFGFPVGR